MSPVYESPDFIFATQRIESPLADLTRPIVIGEGVITIGKTVVCAESEDFYGKLLAEAAAHMRESRLRANYKFTKALLLLALIFLIASLWKSLPLQPALAMLFAIAGLFVVIHMKLADLENDSSAGRPADR
jgi:hypothetical protein